MKHQYTPRNRKDMKLKMATVFSEKIQMLSTELQEILLDDLVTAFENRLNILLREQSTIKFEIAESAEYETIKT